MNKLVRILLLFFVVVCSSCVSRNTHSELQIDYSKLEQEKREVEREYSNLVSKYNALVEKYNGLLDDYNDTQFSYETQNYKTSKQEDIIDRAKDAVYKLKRDFSSFQSGWCDADDIERDIKSVEDKLDGWL